MPSLSMPHSLFEDFSLEFDATGEAQLKSHARKKSGELPQICAHGPHPHLQIRYRQIREVEVGTAGEEFRGEKVNRGSYAVSFRPNLSIATKDGALLLPQVPGKEALSRVTYYHLAAVDFFELRFLRNEADRLLFVQGIDRADLLLRIVAENHDDFPKVTETAFERAVYLLDQANRIAATEAEAFAALCKARLKAAGTREFKKVCETFRALDKTGEAALELASLVQQHAPDKTLLAALLSESIQRLTQYKPRDASLRLLATLEFMTEYQINAMPPSKLLWQTYLAASAERAVGVLRRVFLMARQLDADRDTLEMIYKTWRGFVNSDRQRATKTLTGRRQLTGDTSGRELSGEETLDESGGNAG